MIDWDAPLRDWKSDYQKLKDAGLSTRTAVRIAEMGRGGPMGGSNEYSLRQIAAFADHELLRCPGFGRHSLAEFRTFAGQQSDHAKRELTASLRAQVQEAGRRVLRDQIAQIIVHTASPAAAADAIVVTYLDRQAA